jgi:membrane protein
VAWLTRFTALAASWLLLVMLYMWMPATKVHLKPALIGAFVAAAIWEVSKWGFKLYTSTAVTTSALYGSLGLIPLFLIWIHLTWLIVLFGLEITHTLQTMGSKLQKPGGMRDSRAVFDPYWLLPTAAAIAQAFSRGETLSVGDLAGRLHLPSKTIQELCDQLEQARIVHRLSRPIDDDTGNDVTETVYSLARPADKIDLADLLETTHRLTRTPSDQADGPGWRLLEELFDQQHRSLSNRTLAQIVPSDGAETEGAFQGGRPALVEHGV